MHVFFDPDFDGGAWPGPVHERQAAAGETWVGLNGLLGLLETRLGLRGPGTTAVKRVAQLLPALRATEGFWSASAERDPLATARRLLAWRDELALGGWKGTGGSPVLDALAQVTRAVEPGLPDRLRAVCDRLARIDAEVEVLHTFAAPAELPALWRALFTALEVRGTRVELDALPDATATGDLQASRGEGFRPSGEGSLQLIRPHGVLRAAEELAVWLSTLTEAERRQTVILGGDGVLDRALRSQGLPTLGGTGRHRESPLLQLLPLTLAVAFGPPDPQRALELLTLPETPLPSAVRFRLARALHATPAVDSDGWREALAHGLAQLEEERRAAAAARVDLLFHRSEPGQRLPAGQVRARVQMLASWARGRAAHAEALEPGRWDELLHQLATFEVLLDAAQAAELTAPQLERFVEEATAATPLTAPLTHQAGFASVSSPGAVCGPVDRVVWWNFSLHTAPRPERIPFGPKELAALAEAGVSLQTAAEKAVPASRRWARPHRLARRAVLFLCPRLGEDGDRLFPHPLYDEVLARIPREARGRAEQALERETPHTDRQVRRSTASLLPAPVPQRGWTVDGAQISRREVDSPSSAASLLGCSLQWVLQYTVKLRSGALGNLRSAEQVLGETAHALLAKVLGAKIDRTPEEAEREAHRLFDEEGPRHAAQLFQPGADAERAEVRRITGLAARELFRLIAQGGFQVHSVEEAYRAEALGGTLEGRPDLVLARGKERAVVDLKWSGLKYRRESLELGTSHQLAMYSQLVQVTPGRAPLRAEPPPLMVSLSNHEPAGPGHTGSSFDRLRMNGALPANAYFILRDQRLLTTDGAAFPGGQEVDGPSPEETWRAFELGHAETWKAVSRGALEAAGIGVDPEAPAHSRIEDGVMRLEAPCRFCDFAAVCGRAFEGGAA